MRWIIMQKKTREEIQKEKRQRINQLGEEILQISKEKENAVWQQTWFELCSLAMEVFCPPHLAAQVEDSFMEALMSICQGKFDPKRSPLSYYLDQRIEFNKKSKYLKEKKHPGISIDEVLEEEKPIRVKDREKISGSNLDTGYQVLEDQMEVDAKLLELTSQILHFADHHKKENKNEKLLKCYKIFYTSIMIGFIKEEPENPMFFQYEQSKQQFQHLRDIIKAMKLAFVSYCMKDMDRILIGKVEIDFSDSDPSEILKLDQLKEKELYLILEKIYFGSMKLYGQVVKEQTKDAEDKTNGYKCSNNQPIPIPIPLKVGWSYYNTIEIEMPYRTYTSQFQKFKNEIRQRIQS